MASQVLPLLVPVPLVAAKALGDLLGVFWGVDLLAINNLKWGYVWKLEYTIWLFKIAMEHHYF